jgi:NAD(P)-dependent dehydrogenase (short-subunit alcohol dehydrogenase family)
MKGEAVVITGASTGIGAASAELIARSGFTVFAGIRSDADAARLGALHGSIKPVRLDVTDSASIEAAARLVASSGLQLHGVVNNAGIAVGGPLEFLPLDLLRRQYEVNVFGPVAVTQAFLPQLREHRGRVIFVGSVSGRLAVPMLAAYSSSKFALRAIADAMRRELARAGVRVSLVEPANVATPIWRKGRDSRDEMRRRLGPKAVEHYGQELESLFQTAEAERTAMPVERVSEAILHALTARRPKTHYLIGSRLASVVGALPASVQDRLMTTPMRKRPRPRS